MKTLKIMNELAELDKMRGFLKDCLKGLDISEKDYFKIELALLEICINIIRYAYPQQKGEISLKTWQDDGKVFIEIRDKGVPFDPRTLKKPDVRELVRSEKKGGFGIFLSRSFMDGFDYRREDDQNVLTIFKIVGKESEASDSV